MITVINEMISLSMIPYNMIVIMIIIIMTVMVFMMTTKTTTPATMMIMIMLMTTGSDHKTQTAANQGELRAGL